MRIEGMEQEIGEAGSNDSEAARCTPMQRDEVGEVGWEKAMKRGEG
jgi:hypothetical protein